MKISRVLKKEIFQHVLAIFMKEFRQTKYIFEFQLGICNYTRMPGWAHPAYLHLLLQEASYWQMPHVQLAFIPDPGPWQSFVFGPGHFGLLVKSFKLDCILANVLGIIDYSGETQNWLDGLSFNPHLIYFLTENPLIFIFYFRNSTLLNKKNPDNGRTIRRNSTQGTGHAAMIFMSFNLHDFLISVP